MTKRNPKPKLQVPTRAPRAKGDMFENLRKPEEVESIPFEELVAPPDLPKMALGYLEPPKSTQGTLRAPKPEQVAPVRDFNKRANVLDRDALPSGLFPGSSKKLYDALYLRTLGAVVPTKTIQATRRELRQWSGIKNIKTVAAHLRHLETVGLVMRAWDRGDNEGSVYEVCLPDGLRPPQTTLGDLNPPEGALDRNLVLPSGQKSALGGSSQTIDFQRPSDEPKTSIKTYTEKLDDETVSQVVDQASIGTPIAFVGLFELLAQASTDITGKSPQLVEADKWREVGEVLITELKIATGRTTISSVPAFLAEHLRRRLWKKEKRQIEAEAAEHKATTPTRKMDASQCPDCFGTGMYYPEGFEKGVARCPHTKLTAENVE
jgi:hypothetical protein